MHYLRVFLYCHSLKSDWNFTTTLNRQLQQNPDCLDHLRGFIQDDSKKCPTFVLLIFHKLFISREQQLHHRKPPSMEICLASSHMIWWQGTISNAYSPGVTHSRGWYKSVVWLNFCYSGADSEGNHSESLIWWLPSHLGESRECPGKRFSSCTHRAKI